MNKGIYFYGVTLDKNWNEYNIPGMDSKNPLYKIQVNKINGLASLVSLDEYGHPAIDKNIEDLNWLKTQAEAHMNILHSMMEYSMIIPMKFCTIFYNNEKIKNVLEENYDQFYSALTYLADKEEWSCKVYLNKKEFTDKYLENFKKQADVTPVSKGAAYFKKQKIKSEMKEQIEREIDKLAKVIYNELKQLDINHKLNKNIEREITSKTEEMILNVSVLLDDKEKEKMINYVNNKNNQIVSDCMYIECIGPWPPYNFSPSPHT
ncbi:MAG: GvpL/GvpF family gas vesicle protein [Bacillus sp. (in: firmicutes)]